MSPHEPVELHDGRVYTEAIEINVAWHCNIRCRWCSHASPALPKQFADSASVVASLTTLSKFLRVDHVRILGGEPLLYPGLDTLIREIRATNIGNRVRVLTNGLLLHKASTEFWRNVDEVHISAYPATSTIIESHVTTLTRMAEVHNVTLVVKKFDRFRVSYRAFDGDDYLTQRIYNTCQIANSWRCLTLEGGILYRCPQSAYNYTFSRQSGNGKDIDFLEINTIASALEIKQWLIQKTALTSCRVCAGSVGRLMPHQQMRSSEALLTTSLTEAIDFNYLSTLESDITADNSCVTQEFALYSS